MNTILTRDGQRLTRRVWLLLESLNAAGRVTQGGFRGNDGADASAGTHDVGDVLDLSVDGLTTSQQVALVVELRRRNCCAWVRSAAFGWTKTGPHIHGVMRDSYHGLSPGAQRQVTEYDDGFDGLAGDGRDPHPRPTQSHWLPEADVTPEQEAKIDVLLARTDYLANGLGLGPKLQVLLGRTDYLANKIGIDADLEAVKKNTAAPAIIAAVLAALPDQLTKADVESALRTVLGTLDN